MALEKFTPETILTMDGGRIGKAFEHALRRAVEDCRDRPGTSTARKVSLDLHLSPVADEEGELVDVKLRFDVNDTAPKRKSKVYSMQATKAGLFYNDLSLSDVRQRTFDMTKPRAIRGAGDENEGGQEAAEGNGTR